MSANSPLPFLEKAAKAIHEAECALDDAGYTLTALQAHRLKSQVKEGIELERRKP